MISELIVFWSKDQIVGISEMRREYSFFFLTVCVQAWTFASTLY
jgi:hypothetical protein